MNEIFFFLLLTQIYAFGWYSDICCIAEKMKLTQQNEGMMCQTHFARHLFID